MKKAYTIKDIAQLAGVSKGTVDRVLHNRGKVSEKALIKINAVLKEIDYKPNLIARNLKNNKVYRICVLMPSPDEDVYWEPCLDGVLDGEKEFSPFGMTIEKLYFNPFDKKSFIQQSVLALDKKYDGILLAPLFQKESTDFLKNCKEQGVICFLFNNNNEKSNPEGFIGQDLYLSGRVAAKLIHSSLKSKAEIAIVHIDEVFKNATHMQEKEKGFRSYFNDLQLDGYRVNTFKLKHSNTNNLKKTIKYFIDMHPEINGFFVTNSKIHLLAALIHKKTDDVCLVGYDLLTENIISLNSGVIDFLIHQNPKRQAYLGLAFLADHFLFNKSIPKQTFLPIDIINSESVKSYLEKKD